MTGVPFARAELESAYAHFQNTVAEVARTGDWDLYAELFTPDADFIEHALGRMKGREQIRAWAKKTMGSFPGSHMTGFPALWHVIDTDRGRVISEVDNPMRDPGDGSVITATNITILTYAGDDLWSCEEDVYNPLEFGIAAMRWCRRAEELGTLDDAARHWMTTVGTRFER